MLKKLFILEKKPHKGLLAMEMAIIAYGLVTLVMMLFCASKLPNMQDMLWGRASVVMITVLTWGVYRLLPCRLTVLVRVVAQMSMLSWWYPDTYELNRVLPNLDHVFATWEQQVFGCQPALIFHERMPQAWLSEALDLGYASYYPLIIFVIAWYFFRRYEEFTKCAFIVTASFFIYYIFYDLVPVVGPQFYYEAVGLDRIAAGEFPDVGHYFFNHQECLPIPGVDGGFFHNLVQNAHDAGERPTAAFPSSHVGVSTVIFWLLLRERNGWIMLFFVPVFTLLCFSTVYIQAHYAIDAIAGLITGTMLYFALDAVKIRK